MNKRGINSAEKKNRIMVIDDEISIRFILEITLSEKYKVTSFENGREALDYLKQGNLPDVIICDLQMPEIDGYAFTNEIRNNDMWSDIPIIILSAMEESSEKIKCFDIGADDYVVKPFNPKEVEARVKRRIVMRKKMLSRK
jgi:two-component system, chemotaxis family, chemotaxis protein CheY